MIYTARDLIRGSLRLCKAIEPGEAPDDDEYNDALGAFNDMLDSWNVEALMLPFTASSIVIATAGAPSYSVGPGGDWNITRPHRIRSASIRINSLDTPLAELLLDEYAAIPSKSTTSPQPLDFYYEPQFPLGQFILYPVAAVDVNVIISYDTQLTQVTLDTDLSTLPPGYRQAMRYNLALLTAPEYKNSSVSDEVKAEAKRSKGVVKSSNSKSLDANMDYRVPGRSHGGYNWRSDS